MFNPFWFQKLLDRVFGRKKYLTNHGVDNDLYGMIRTYLLAHLMIFSLIIIFIFVLSRYCG